MVHSIVPTYSSLGWAVPCACKSSRAGAGDSKSKTKESCQVGVARDGGRSRTNKYKYAP